MKSVHGPCMISNVFYAINGLTVKLRTGLEILVRTRNLLKLRYSACTYASQEITFWKTRQGFPWTTVTLTFGIGTRFFHGRGVAKPWRPGSGVQVDVGRSPMVPGGRSFVPSVPPPLSLSQQARGLPSGKVSQLLSVLAIELQQHTWNTTLPSMHSLWSSIMRCTLSK